jgi:S1-C subfamily serine protease
MRIVKKLFIVSPLMTLFLSAWTNSAQGQDGVNEKQWLSYYTRPSVVMLYAGCQGKYSYNDGSKSFSQDDLVVFGFGSGYFVTANGYVVTNAHVIEYVNGDSGKSKCKDKLFDRFIEKLAPTLEKKPEEIRENETLKKQIKDKSKLDENTFKLTSGYILPNQPKSTNLKNGDSSFKVTKADDPEKRDVAILKVEGLENVPVLELATYKVKDGDKVWAFGYPSDNFIDGTLTIESGFNPSGLEGSISNTQAKLKNGASVLQVQIPASPGSSGGPLVDREGKVIGMTTFRKGEGNPGVAFAIPASTIREVFKEATNEENKQGPTDEEYRKGLNYFRQGNYTDAIASFEQVKKLFEPHSDVTELISTSTTERKKPRPNYILWGMGALLAGSTAALGFMLYRRNLGSTHRQRSTDDRPGTIVDRQPPTVSQAFLELETPLSATPIQCYLRKPRHQLGRDGTWSDFDIPAKGWEVMSGRHAVLVREGENYRIFDGDFGGSGKPSSNGIWVNGQQIDPFKGFLLTNGAQLQFGQDPKSRVVMTYFNPAETVGSTATQVDFR